MHLNGFIVGLGLGVEARPVSTEAGGGTTITATIIPNLSNLNDSQTPADGYSAGAYNSGSGTIVSVVETYLVNGLAQSSGFDLAAGDLVQVSVLVSDSVANSQTFTTALITVSAATAAAITATATRGTDQVAPEGIWFEAVPTGFDVTTPSGGDIYDPTFHDILYVWDFGDTGTLPVAIKKLISWDDRSIGFGRQVSHIFSAPGTYDVTCTGYDRSGNIAVSNTLNITVSDPAFKWGASNTIVVALDNDFTGAPSGAHHNTMVGAEGAYKALGGTGRMLLKRGETVAFSDNRVRTNHPNFHLGAWGTGARPIVTNKLWVNDMQTSKDANIWGLDFAHGWDSTTETGTQTDGITFDRGRHASVYDCNFDGCEKGIYIPSTATSGAFIFQEVSITNWRDYGALLGPAGDAVVGLKGCAIHQHVDALGSGKTTGVNNKHGPMRYSADGPTNKLYMGCVDFFSNNGRTASSGVPHHQPAFRISGGMTGQFMNLERISAEGGINQLSLSDSAAARETVPTNICVDKFICVGSYATQYNVARGLGATTLRNGALIQPDTPHGPTAWRWFMSYEDAGDDPANLDEEIKTYSCSFANLKSDGNDSTVTPSPYFGITTGKNGFNNPTEDNNIEHMPNSASQGDTGDTPLNTLELWAARSKGMQYAGFPLDTSYKPPAGSVALYGADTGSPAKNDATGGVWAIDDIHGTLRAINPSRGVLN